MRHGRKSSAKTFNGFKEHIVLDLDSRVTREVVVRPANEPEHAVVALVADVFDAVTSERFHAHAISVDQGIELVRGSTGTAFDPTVVEAFLDVAAAR